MKRTFIIGLMLVASIHAEAHAVGGRGGASGAAGGMQNGVGAARGHSSTGAQAAGNQGNGGRYHAVDDYQPWPQEEMKQFAKPEFVAYDGK